MNNWKKEPLSPKSVLEQSTEQQRGKKEQNQIKRLVANPFTRYCNGYYMGDEKSAAAFSTKFQNENSLHNFHNFLSFSVYFPARISNLWVLFDWDPYFSLVTNRRDFSPVAFIE